MAMTTKFKSGNDTFLDIIVATEGAYTKEQLQHGWFAQAMRFFNSRPDKTWGDVSSREAQIIITRKKNPAKEDVLAVAFLVLKNETIFKEFLTSIPPYLVTLLELLTWQSNIDRGTAEEITGVEMFVVDNDRWKPPTLRTEYYLFTTKITGNGFGYYSGNIHELHVTLSLPLPLKRLLSSYLSKPEGYYLSPIPVPEIKKGLFFNAEESINRELPTLLAYYMQGNIKYSDKGKPNVAAAKKLSRVLQLTEFFADGNFQATRGTLMAGMVYDNIGNAADVPACETIKALFVRNYLQHSPATYLFTLLKGFGNFHSSEFNSDAALNVLKMFQQLPEDEWVLAANLYTYADSHFLDLAPVSDWKLNNKITYDEEVYLRRRNLLFSEFNDFVFRPFLAGSAFLFASFGLMEICYTKLPDTGFGRFWFSEYDGLEAVKLTALGAYVLGIKNDYQPPASQSANRLELDPNSLMIKVEGNQEIAQIQLNNFAQKVSGNRYQFSPALFLRDCKKRSDIANKISLFKQSVGSELPPNWQTYLQTLSANSQLIQNETKMLVFKLPPDNKELHRLLVQDDVLRKIIIKAEQFHVLVNASLETAFKARLKELGILLE